MGLTLSIDNVLNFDKAKGAKRWLNSGEGLCRLTTIGQSHGTIQLHNVKYFIQNFPKRVDAIH